MTADFPPCVTPAVLAAVHANDRRNPMPDTTDPLDVTEEAMWLDGLELLHGAVLRGDDDIRRLTIEHDAIPNLVRMARAGEARRAAVLTLAEELETESIRYIRAADGEPADSLMRKYVTGRVTSLQQSAARLRAAVESFGAQQ